MEKKIKSALISVYYKDKLDDLVKQLHKLGVTIYSTGGTLQFIEKLGIPVVAVENLTNFPEILGGRVKTLHPNVFGGILARRDNENDMQQLGQFQIPTIDMVVVDLYPFEETVKSTDDESQIIEKIDIGGVSLIRAAAKNYNDTLIVSSKSQYQRITDILQQQNGTSTKEQRKQYAFEAFALTSAYDGAISNYFNSQIDRLSLNYNGKKELRYGENPHQNAQFYGNLSEVFETLGGKDLSYNNLVDIESALYLIHEFKEPTFAIIKHTNSCGLATRSSIAEAYKAALTCDPVSAFGGVLVCNGTIDKEAAEIINTLFFEVLAAMDFTVEALQILSSKKNRILLKIKNLKHPERSFKSLLNGVLCQSYDSVVETNNKFNCVTNRKPTNEEISDLEFAITAVKHLKSNGIVLVKNKQLIGMGCGQTSRVDALESAIKKAAQFGFDTKGAVMASEAFFPFSDCVEIANSAGIVAIAQPGGSIKDQDSVNAANSFNQCMILTGVRHFKH